MAIGQPDQPLVAGIAPTPAVTGPGNVITPDAVTALVDSFGKGVITGDDLAAHSGMKTFLENRAEGQRLREETSPQAIQQRQAAREAATSQSNLVTAQAGGLESQVPAQTALAASTTAKAQSEVWDKQAIDLYKEYNPTLYKEDGTTPDAEGMAEAGRHYLRAKDALAYAGQGLASQPSKEVDPATGQAIVVQRNANGEDVTPREDNPAYTHYRDLRQSAIETLFAPTKAHPSRGEGTGATPAGTPADSSPAPAPAAEGSPLVSSITKPPSAGIPIYQSGQGRATGPVPGTLPTETRDEVRKEPQYEFWSQKLGSMRDFAKAAQAIYTPSTDKTIGPVPMNEKDFALMNSLRQLATPVTSGGAGGRGTPDLQGAQIEKSLPLLEKLSDWKQVVAQTGTLTEGTRRRLIKLGNDYIRSKEDTVRPVLQWATENSGLPHEKLLGLDLRPSPFNERQKHGVGTSY